MKDGRVIPLDLVVLATGFRNMQEGIRRMLGDEIADKLGPVWGFDQDHQMRAMWRRTPQDGLWLMGGALIDARLHSRFLAIEIKASLEGILPDRKTMPIVSRA
jgi:putative flavoprotein involved in K+ transport